MKKKILITGGTGFIGYHLAKKCIRMGWEVTYVLCTDGSKGTEDRDISSERLARDRRGGLVVGPPTRLGRGVERQEANKHSKQTRLGRMEFKMDGKNNQPCR